MADSHENAGEQAEGKDNKQTSLHHSLLGPSLQKAGQDSVDQSKVAEIIYQASLGSKFFKHEEKRDEQLTKKVEILLQRKKHLESLDLSAEIGRVDERIARLDVGRDLSQYIVHVDCDAFYASVEELDRPELKNVPMAVGKGVLTTCNYKAREFGCRSGMAGHIAQSIAAAAWKLSGFRLHQLELCPQLVFMPLNFEKYSKKAGEIRAIIAKYDARYEAASVDEAYLNITAYCEDHGTGPADVVNNLRAEILTETKISVSAGIGPNARIAKIASNKNKPNGQFIVPNDREEIMNFMADLPVRKVTGIGRVLERELLSVGIKTCKDIYPMRGMLQDLFGQKAAEFLIHCYLGIGRTDVHPVEDYERKSVGTERTFADIRGADKLRERMRMTAEDLEKDLAELNLAFRTLVLKVKLHTYGVYSRQRAVHRPIHTAEDIYQYALPLLTSLEAEFKDKGGLKIRLMGLRGTQLVEKQKKAREFWGKWVDTSGKMGGKKRKLDDDGWEIWSPEGLEISVGDQPVESQVVKSQAADVQVESTKDITLEILSQEGGEQQPWQCPICNNLVAADDRLFNEHIDWCLSRDVIRNVVRESSVPAHVTPKPPSPKRPKPLEKEARIAIDSGHGAHFPIFKQKQK